MIRIICCYGNQGSISSVKISGHANFAENSKDIVCASISSIAFGSFSFLSSFCNEEIECEKNKNFLAFYSKKISVNSQISLSMMIHQFENVSNFYPSYIEIKKFSTR